MTPEEIQAKTERRELEKQLAKMNKGRFGKPKYIIDEGKIVLESQKDFSKTTIKDSKYITWLHKHKEVCAICGTTVNVEFNHIDRDLKGNRIDRSDKLGIMLCSYHHKGYGIKAEPYYSWEGGIYWHTEFNLKWFYEKALKLRSEYITAKVVNE